MAPRAAHRERTAVQVEQSACRIGALGQYPFAAHALAVHRADLDPAQVRAIAEFVHFPAQVDQLLASARLAGTAADELVQQCDRLIVTGTWIARLSAYHVPSLVEAPEILAAQIEARDRPDRNRNKQDDARGHGHGGAPARSSGRQAVYTRPLVFVWLIVAGYAMVASVQLCERHHGLASRGWLYSKLECVARAGVMESVSRLVILVLVVSGAWWLWSGPIRNMRTVTFEEQMELNLDNMKRCLRSKEYVAGATGVSSEDPQGQCAKKYRLYLHEGKWYSFDQKRPG